jgi:hypothetical protein
MHGRLNVKIARVMIKQVDIGPINEECEELYKVAAEMTVSATIRMVTDIPYYQL